METTIAEIITIYGAKLWLAFVILVVTGFIMTLVKNFITNLVNYYKVRTSDLGYGTMIYWSGQLKRVTEINFKQVKLTDDKEIIFIPISTWLGAVKQYPQPRYDQFDEDKWNTRPWDGKSDRRGTKNGFGEEA